MDLLQKKLAALASKMGVVDPTQNQTNHRQLGNSRIPEHSLDCGAKSRRLRVASNVLSSVCKAFLTSALGVSVRHDLRSAESGEFGQPYNIPYVCYHIPTRPTLTGAGQRDG